MPQGPMARHDSWTTGVRNFRLTKSQLVGIGMRLLKNHVLWGCLIGVILSLSKIGPKWLNPGAVSLLHATLPVMRCNSGHCTFKRGALLWPVWRATYWQPGVGQAGAWHSYAAVHGHNLTYAAQRSICKRRRSVALPMLLPVPSHAALCYTASCNLHSWAQPRSGGSAIRG